MLLLLLSIITSFQSSSTTGNPDRLFSTRTSKAVSSDQTSKLEGFRSYKFESLICKFQVQNQNEISKHIYDTKRLKWQFDETIKL